MRAAAGGSASPRLAPSAAATATTTTTTTPLLVPSSSSSVAMPPPRLAHLRRSSLLLLLHHPPHPLASSPVRPPLRPPPLLPRAMAGVAQPGVAAGSAEYEEVPGCLSSLITQRVRADTGNRGNQWELMAKYLQILELEEPIAQLKVVHVAGTKGKVGHFGRKVYKLVDVAVLEVGLGGKYDATNVVKAPVVCGISSLGYDHMEILGNTLREIAEEKAGI